MSEEQKPVERTQKTTETHRYNLSFALILGFLVIMGVALAGEIFWGYTGLQTLASTFSGWITAVIGFYFLQQNTERAQVQSKMATKEAAAARIEAISASKAAAEKTMKVSELYDTGKANVSSLQEQILKQQEFIEELLSKLEEITAEG